MASHTTILLPLPVWKTLICFLVHGESWKHREHHEGRTVQMRSRNFFTRASGIHIVFACSVPHLTLNPDPNTFSPSFVLVRLPAHSLNLQPFSQDTVPSPVEGFCGDQLLLYPRKPRLCLTTQSTTMMQERGMFTSRPMLMFAQPHKESNSKNLTTTTSYMGCRKGERSPEFEIRGSTSCNCTWRRDTSLTLNLLCLLGCVGLTASGSEMLMS